MVLASLLHYPSTVWLTYFLHPHTSACLWLRVLGRDWSWPSKLPTTHNNYHSCYCIANQSNNVLCLSPADLDLEHEPEQAPTPQSESRNTWGPATHVPIEVDHPSDLAPAEPEIKENAATFDPITSLQGPLPLDPPTVPTMSVNVTTTAPTTNPPLNGGMQGVPPTIFDGTWSGADEFWLQFQKIQACWLSSWINDKAVWQSANGPHLHSRPHD